MIEFIKPIYAHCDGPCGHYETDTLKNSAKTCRKLIMKLKALKLDTTDDLKSKQDFVRLVMLKEEHAQLCKQQIYILWSDYFKPPHFAKIPDLHQQLHQAALACSLVKQTIDLKAADDLIAQIVKIDELFTQVAS